MAEVAVEVFLPKLLELLKKVQLLGEVQNDIRLLHDTLEWLHLSLRERDEICNRDERVKLWVTQIRVNAFDAENIIDEYLLKIEQHHHHRDRKVSCLSCIRKPFQWMALHDMGQKIKVINVRLDRIKANASEYGMKPGAEGQGSSSSSREKPMRRPIFEQSDDPVGIGKDADEVAKLLVEGNQTRRSVVSISGMGGLGKTTLARHVYNRREVKTHFQCSAWITVSQGFKVHDLLCDVIYCITRIEKENLRPKDEEELRRQLLECLKGKVYLVVLDDIWNIDAWNDLATSLPDEKNGSRVLLTTRNKQLARHVDPLTKLHELRLLTEDECWELLCKKAFPIDHKCPSHNLKEVGKKMVKKCGGLPLAVVVLGGLLSTKGQTLHEWIKVFDSVSWQWSESDHEISSILALSYNDLPYYLKSCFLHLASFSEDHRINPDRELICTWVAEGFIKQRGSETLEDIGEDYLLELTDRSMIQIAQWDDATGRVEAYSIHDLLRDIAIRKAKEEKFLDVYGNGDSDASTTARRLTFTRQDDINKWISLNHSHRYLRSLYCFSRNSYGERIELKNIHGRFKFLRVMHINVQMNLSVLDEIGHLIHLRYVDLRFFPNSKDTVISLPSNFGRLYNLQTLRLNFGGGTRIYIHDDIWKMKELRHLCICDGYFPEETQHLQLSKLTNLQTLWNVSAGDWIKDDLGKMTSLRRLEIHGDLTSYQDALVESIGKLMNLRHLRLEFRDRGMIVLPIRISHLVNLETLTFEGHMDALPPVQDFPANLTCLSLWNCTSKQDQDPVAILEKLPKLRLLLLEGYVREKMSCSADGFPELRILLICHMPNLEEWMVEEGAMPKLKQLHLEGCNKLKMIPEGFQHLNALQELHLYDLDNDFLQRTEKDGEDWFKIKHIPLIERHRRQVEQGSPELVKEG